MHLFHKQYVSLWVGVLAIACLGGMRDDAYRRGVVAYEAGDYGAALLALESVAGTHPDPGKVAYALGTTLAKLGRYREAALEMERVLEDATRSRQVKARFGLGTMLAQHADGLGRRQALGILRDAQKQLQQSSVELSTLNEAERLEAGLKVTDVEHQLNLVQALLVARQNEPDTPDKPENNKGREEMADEEAGMGNNNFNPNDIDPRTGLPYDQNNGAGSNQRNTGMSRAGAGSLPPLLDARNNSNLTEEQAKEHLRRAMDRILRKAQEPEAEIPGARDW